MKRHLLAAVFLVFVIGALAGASSVEPTHAAPPDDNVTLMGDPIFSEPWAPGEYRVRRVPGTITREGREVPYRLYLPVPFAGREEPAPVVVFLPGFLLKTIQYGPLASHIASHGFVVIAVDPQVGLFDSNHLRMRDDTIAVLDHVLAVLGERADPNSVATMGHSLGGKIATMIAGQEPRVRGLMGIDPVNGGGPGGSTPERPDILPESIENLTYPILMVGQTTDSGPRGCAPASGNFQVFFNAATGTDWRAAIEIVGADHTDFIDRAGVFARFCPQGPADEERVRELTRMFATAYLHFTLNDDMRYEPYLSNPVEYGVGEGEVIVTR
jgi:pimeloyl-ACP methyl ester carboxylesterase